MSDKRKITAMAWNKEQESGTQSWSGYRDIFEKAFCKEDEYLNVNVVDREFNRHIDSDNFYIGKKRNKREFERLNYFLTKHTFPDFKVREWAVITVFEVRGEKIKDGQHLSKVLRDKIKELAVPKILKKQVLKKAIDIYNKDKQVK